MSVEKGRDEVERKRKSKGRENLNGRKLSDSLCRIGAVGEMGPRGTEAMEGWSDGTFLLPVSVEERERDSSCSCLPLTGES